MGIENPRALRRNRRYSSGRRSGMAVRNRAMRLSFSRLRRPSSSGKNVGEAVADSISARASWAVRERVAVLA